MSVWANRWLSQTTIFPALSHSCGRCADFGDTAGITAAQIGRDLVKLHRREQNDLWWGGFGNSTEHTAFLRLKQGMSAPRSGSVALNGKTVAEQIGAQIFIDSWAMVAPGNPRLAFDLAGKAASVSHDGEAVLAAQFLAVMEAQAFVEPDINALFELGLSFFPPASLVTRLARDILSLARRTAGLGRNKSPNRRSLWLSKLQRKLSYHS